MSSLISKSGRVIDLRPPQAGDETLLFNFARTLEAEDTFVLLNPDLPVTFTEEVEYLKTCLKKMAANWQVYYLAFHQDQLIGTCQVTVGGRRKMHLGTFGITLLPPFRRDGIGFNLANLVIHEAQTKMHLSLLTLEVFANNLPALSLYQKLKFTEYGRLPGGLKYQDQFVDSIFMVKTL